MKFYKMHGIGNDFILFSNLEGEVYSKVKNLGEWVQNLCIRRLGIGADGLILLDSSLIGDFKMRIFNPDGSEAQMCGNGIRCAAVLYQELFSPGKNEFQVETLAGLKKVIIKKKSDGMVARVEMGKPIFKPSEIPFSGGSNPISFKIKVKDKILSANCVSMGNPHCVVLASENDNTFTQSNWMDYGVELEKHPFFPEKTNVEFVWGATSDREFVVKVWERGAGRTLGCGTGGSAIMAVLHKKYALKSCIVKMEGGTLYLEIEENGNIIMEGAIKKVYQGELLF